MKSSNIHAFSLCILLSSALSSVSYGAGSERAEFDVKKTVFSGKALRSVIESENGYTVDDTSSEMDSGLRSNEKSLILLPDVKKYIKKLCLEINPENVHELLGYATGFYTQSFNTFNKGVLLNWTSAVSFDEAAILLDHMHTIKKLRFSVAGSHDVTSELSALISGNIQIYEFLEELDLSNCHLSETDIEDIIGSIGSERLKKIILTGNASVTTPIRQQLEEQFPGIQVIADLATTTAGLAVPRDSVMVKDIYHESVIKQLYREALYGNALSLRELEEHAQKNPLAQGYLSVMYGTGEGVGINQPKANQLTDESRAALLKNDVLQATDTVGNRAASYLLGTFHESGRGWTGVKNTLEAFRYYFKAAEAGDDMAYYALGQMYWTGNRPEPGIV